MPGKMNFKTSPFYKVERFIGSTVTIYEAAQNQRKSAFIEFRLSPDLIRLVKPERPGTDPTHQLRLFCTTKASAEVAERVPATVEFPTSCELRINTTPYSSSLKGSKKQAGAPCLVSGQWRPCARRTSNFHLSNFIRTTSHLHYYLAPSLLPRTPMPAIRSGRNYGSKNVSVPLVRPYDRHPPSVTDAHRELAIEQGIRDMGPRPWRVKSKANGRDSGPAWSGSVYGPDARSRFWYLEKYQSTPHWHVGHGYCWYEGKNRVSVSISQ